MCGRSYDDYLDLKETKYNFKQKITKDLFEYAKSKNIIVDHTRLEYPSDFYIYNNDHENEIFINVRLLPEQKKDFFDNILNSSSKDRSSFQRIYNLNNKEKTPFYILFIAGENQELPFENVLEKNNIKMIIVKENDIDDFSITEIIDDDLKNIKNCCKNHF